MVLQWGYFKYHGRFFELNKFRQEDRDLFLNVSIFDSKYFDFKEYYNLQMAYDHRKRILALTQWKQFDEQSFEHYINMLVQERLISYT